VQIFASQQRSYRDLPIRYMENTTDYRDEKSGELHGLSRVRSLTQDDSHVFCTDDQLEQEVGRLLKAAKTMYSELAIALKFRLSYRDDSDAYLGDSGLWQHSQAILKKLADNNKLDYYEQAGEAAFYGPKIDFIAIDALGREWQVATVQLDFVQPQRFNLNYTDADGQAQIPVMIHCALLGTIERFLSVYIEHTAGRFPFWLAPEQIRILTVNDSVKAYVKEVSNRLNDVVLMKPLKYNELRFEVDDRNESLGKKIREAEESKVPVIIILGPKDQSVKKVSIRLNNKEQTVGLERLDELLLKL
ncbi:MAG TPA: threonine--tRNA ligase, partial [Candidatus Saccharimonadales bacterium]